MLTPLLLIVAQLAGQPSFDLECGPYVARSGQVMIKLKPFADWMEASAQWIATEKRVTIRRDERTVEFWVGRRSAKVNNMTVSLAEPPVVVCGQITVPLRPLAEAFGMKVALGPASDEVIVTDRGREKHIALPRHPVVDSGPGPVFQSGYPPEGPRRGAWVALQQFLFALRDGRTADAQSRCTPGFVEAYDSRFFHPLRPFRVDRFELQGWQDATGGALYVRGDLQVRDVTTRETQHWAFKLVPGPDGWHISSAVKQQGEG